MSGHRQAPGQLSPAEDLHQTVLVDQSRGSKGLRRNDITFELLQGVEVHHHVGDPERVLETLQLRHPLLQRELTTLEARLHVVAGALALRSPTCGLAALSAD